MPASLSADVHYCDNSGVCHIAAKAACSDDDPDTADLLQLDGLVTILSVNLGVNIRHDGLSRGPNGNETNTWHYAGSCATGDSPGY